MSVPRPFRRKPKDSFPVTTGVVRRLAAKAGIAPQDTPSTFIGLSFQLSALQVERELQAREAVTVSQTGR